MKTLLGIFLALTLLPAPSSARSCGGRRVSVAAQGCYTGTGDDNRKIPTGIDQPGLLLVYNTDVSAAAAGVYRIPEGGPGDSSCKIGNAGAATCGVTNEIQVLTADYFEIGSAGAVNTNGDPYCWFEWATGTNHGTFTYTGDGDSATRAIPIQTAAVPGMAMIQLDGTAGCFGAGNFHIRTNAMPTDVSYGWYNVGEAPRTNVIRNLVAGAINVGPCANELGKVYRGAWFVEGPGYGDAFAWIGDGDSGGSCADAGDQQVLTPDCAPKSVITVGCQGNVGACGAQGQACVSAGHSGVVPAIRGINQGVNVTGPGHMTVDFGAIFSTGSLIDDVIGHFTSSSFTVAGTGSFESNLNDVGLKPYSWVTCANAPVIGTITPADWCFNANTVACFRSDIDFPGGVIVNQPLSGNNNCSSSSLSGGTVPCGFPGCDCDLVTNTGTADATNVVIGERSIAFDKSLGQSATCDMAAACNEFDLGQSGASLTVMGFFRTDVDEDAIMLAKSGSSNQQYAMGRTAASDAFYCQVKNASGTVLTDDMPGFTTGAYHFGACVFDNAGNTLAAYFDGALSGSPTAVATDLQGGNGTFGLAYDGTAASFNGNENIVAVYAGAVSATDLCAACSCGWSRVGCQCFDADPTVYVDEGLNDSVCGNCALPACNKLAPS